jgi:transposase
MSMQLSQQAEELLGHSDLVIITERVDDVVLLLGQMSTMGVPDILDRPMPRHGKQRGLRWGWTAVMWLAPMLTEGDHRKVAVEVSIKGMHHTLRRLTAPVIEPLDCRDDRRSPLRTHVSKPQYWHQIERDLHERGIEVHALPAEGIRGEATTVSGAHEVTAEGLLQCGHSQDDPTRPQSKGMLGSLAPLGMPLATDVLSGEGADEGVSLTLMERIRPGVKTPGRLCVGDGQMRALATRASIVGHPDGYCSPLPCTGATAEAMNAWSSAGVARGKTSE